MLLYQLKPRDFITLLGSAAGGVDKHPR